MTSRCETGLQSHCAVERAGMIRRSHCGLHRGQRSEAAHIGRTYDRTVLRLAFAAGSSCPRGRSTYGFWAWKEERDGEQETCARADRGQAAACVDVLTSQGSTVADAVRQIGVTEVILIESWRRYYNAVRPHASLG